LTASDFVGTRQVQLHHYCSGRCQQKNQQVFHDHHQSYGLLTDSFESVAANVVKKASWLLRALFQTIGCARSHSFATAQAELFDHAAKGDAKTASPQSPIGIICPPLAAVVCGI